MTKVRVTTVEWENTTSKTVMAYSNIEEPWAFKKWCGDMSQMTTMVGVHCFWQPTEDDMTCIMGGNGITIKFEVLTDQTIDDKMMA